MAELWHVNFGRAIIVQHCSSKVITSRPQDTTSLPLIVANYVLLLKMLIKGLTQGITLYNSYNKDITFHSPGPGYGISADSVMGWASSGLEATSTKAQETRWLHFISADGSGSDLHRG